MNYTVPEDVGIKNIRQFYDRLKEMLKSDDMVVLDFAGANGVHLSAALVVLAAHREAKESGKTIRLKNLSDAVRRQLYLSGFNI